MLHYPPFDSAEASGFPNRRASTEPENGRKSEKRSFVSGFEQEGSASAGQARIDCDGQGDRVRRE